MMGRVMAGRVVWVQGTTWRLVAPNWLTAFFAEGVLSLYALVRGRLFVRICNMPLYRNDDPLDVVNRMNEFWEEV